MKKIFDIEEDMTVYQLFAEDLKAHVNAYCTARKIRLEKEYAIAVMFPKSGEYGEIVTRVKHDRD